MGYTPKLPFIDGIIYDKPKNMFFEGTLFSNKTMLR